MRAVFEFFHSGWARTHWAEHGGPTSGRSADVSYGEPHDRPIFGAESWGTSAHGEPGHQTAPEKIEYVEQPGSRGYWFEGSRGFLDGLCDGISSVARIWQPPGSFSSHVAKRREPADDWNAIGSDFYRALRKL
jgi:hypothetical protein